MFKVLATLSCLAACCLTTLAQSGAPAPAPAATATAAGSPSAAQPDEPAPTPTPTPVPARSEVFRIQDRNALIDYKPDVNVIRRMVDALVINVTGQALVGAAWGSLVKANDVVGIKVCANGAPLFSTHYPVVNAICEGLIQAGVPAQNIVVFDREEELLKAAGYRVKGGGYRLMWTEGSYDPAAVVSSPVSGRLIYGDLLFSGRKPSSFNAEPAAQDKHGPSADGFSNESHISRILTKVVTKVINVPVMADHTGCGLSGALFNMTIQNVDNWRRLVQPPVRGDPEIPELYANPQIGGKVVLNIMDALVAEYAGAPIGDLNYAVQYGTLLASRDPVAIDSVALRQIDVWRKQAKMDPASKDARYVETAFRYGLGNADFSRIDIREIR
ncbi:MAG: DUF362 domain-containing protein [Verrucomicrobia bacterium]|nr:DUF362 domain-containing protein [Verrucomicrobiota bacterium]